MITDLQLPVLPVFPVFEDPKWFAQNPAASAEHRQHLSAGKKFKIIVIDDEELIAATVVEILNEEGFGATAVSNRAAAIELAKDLQPNVVLSDVIMPGLNGVETGIRLREIVPDCKIILFSGQGGHRGFTGKGPRPRPSLRYSRQAHQARTIDQCNSRSFALSRVILRASPARSRSS
jgi:Response regulator receiver domain